MYITLYLFICIRFICIYLSFSKANGAQHLMLGYVPHITTGLTDFHSFIHTSLISLVASVVFRTTLPLVVHFTNCEDWEIVITHD